MPTEIYIAVLIACVAVVALTVFLIMAGLHLKARADSLEQNASRVMSDLSGLIAESKALAVELKQITASLTGSVEDVEHMTRTARAWTDRADRLVEAVGSVTEPPVFFLSRNIKTFGAIAKGVLQTLLAPKKS